MQIKQFITITITTTTTTTIVLNTAVALSRNAEICVSCHTNMGGEMRCRPFQVIFF